MLWERLCVCVDVCVHLHMRVCVWLSASACVLRFSFLCSFTRSASVSLCLFVFSPSLCISPSRPAARALAFSLATALSLLLCFPPMLSLFPLLSPALHTPPHPPPLASYLSLPPSCRSRLASACGRGRSQNGRWIGMAQTLSSECHALYHLNITNSMLQWREPDDVRWMVVSRTVSSKYPQLYSLNITYVAVEGTKRFLHIPNYVVVMSRTLLWKFHKLCYLHITNSITTYKSRIFDRNERSEMWHILGSII